MGRQTTVCEENLNHFGGLFLANPKLRDFFDDLGFVRVFVCFHFLSPLNAENQGPFGALGSGTLGFGTLGLPHSCPAKSY